MTKQQERRKKYKISDFKREWDLYIAESMTLRGRGLVQWYLRMDPPDYNGAERILNDPLFINERIVARSTRYFRES